MSEHYTELTSKDFDSKTKKGKWVLDFWATWCGPCRMLAPVFEEVAKEMKSKVNFGKIDIDGQQELAEKFEVMSIPTLIFLKDGKIVERIAGLISKDELISLSKGI
ncbi:MAG: thioredoxin [Nanoarchaeota archaeon]